jgi:hypothetical protein
MYQIKEHHIHMQKEMLYIHAYFFVYFVMFNVYWYKIVCL